jgi:hypothetical protein
MKLYDWETEVFIVPKAIAESWVHDAVPPPFPVQETLLDEQIREEGDNVPFYDEES